MKKYFFILLALSFAIPTTFAEVAIQNDQQYIGDDGAFHVVGEIQNDLDSPPCPGWRQSAEFMNGFQ